MTPDQLRRLRAFFTALLFPRGEPPQEIAFPQPPTPNADLTLGKAEDDGDGGDVPRRAA